MEFMEEDKTDEIEFRGHAYLLQEFLRNAAKNGIKGYPITVWIVTAIQITATSAIQNKEATKFMAMINEDNTYR